MERERILSEQRDTQDFLEKKADHAFQGERAAQRRQSEAQSELDSREWRMQIADIALHETGSSNSRGWNFIRQIDCSDSKGKKLAM